MQYTKRNRLAPEYQEVIKKIFLTIQTHTKTKRMVKNTSHYPALIILHIFHYLFIFPIWFLRILSNFPISFHFTARVNFNLIENINVNRKRCAFQKRESDLPWKHKESPCGHHKQCPPPAGHEVQALSVGYKHLVCLVCLSRFCRRMLPTLRAKFIKPSPFPLNPCPKRNLKFRFSVELCLKRNDGLGWLIGIFS